jgi:hypothetical protein
MPNKSIATVLLLLFLATIPSFQAASASQPQAIKIVGKYAYKTYREGKGGFVNALEITKAPGAKYHVSFGGTYLYMAGKDETFHEGSGEGEGQLVGNTLSANLNDGAGGTCRLTITFSGNTATVKPSPNCALNVDPAGVYQKETKAKSLSANTVGAATGASASKSRGFEVCPDPKTPCHSRTRRFAAYELPFRLPVSLKPKQEYKSEPFYGVIIKTYESEDCDADDHTASIERERIAVQKTYPRRKVFASYSCPNMDALSYDFPGLMDASRERVLINTFIAVYAGRTSQEAEEFLVYLQTIYPQAMLKGMTVSYSLTDQ